MNKNITHTIQEILAQPTLSLLLQEGIAEAWYHLQKNCNNENIYTFGLYTSGEYNYLIITANTEEGLTRKALSYQERPPYQNKPLETLLLQLKWSPCDWDYHECVHPKAFSKIEEILNELDELGQELYENTHDEQLLKIVLYQPLHTIFIQALLSFKNQLPHSFQNVLWSVWKGDQSEEERLSFIRALNGDTLASSYKNESNEALLSFLSNSNNSI